MVCYAGVAVPLEKQAVGWRMAVYWPEDSTLHDGEIVGYDNVSLRHHVRYDCGDQEHVTLKGTKVSSACCVRCAPESDEHGRQCQNLIYGAGDAAAS